MRLYDQFALVLLLSSVLRGQAVSVQKEAGCDSPVTLDPTSNPFVSRTLFPVTEYRDAVLAAAERVSDPAVKAKARQIANVGIFLWLDKLAAIGELDQQLKQVPCDQIIGLVLNKIPGRNCPNAIGFIPNDELTIGQYKAEYIDTIAKIINANPNVAIAIIHEPQALPNLIVNSKLSSCQQAASNYEEGSAYAMKSLNQPNVVLYADAGHGGWLGWDENLKPGAQQLAKIYKLAGSPASVRGFSTNVASYNAWILEPGEFADEPDAKWNKAQDESRFVTLFGQALKEAGFPNHAIMDTSRNGVSGLRDEWGDWCNVAGAGFGVRPTSIIEDDSGFVDAFVWVKHGGVSDGTSDAAAYSYDSFCGKKDAFKPSGEAGSWNQAYFEMLVRNAIPPIQA